MRRLHAADAGDDLSNHWVTETELALSPQAFKEGLTVRGDIRFAGQEEIFCSLRVLPVLTLSGHSVHGF